MKVITSAPGAYWTTATATTSTGTATVTVTGVVGGEEVTRTLDVPYDARGCA